MKKKTALLIMLLLPCAIFSQEEGKKTAQQDATNIPVQSQYSNKFKITNLYFNKRIDLGGKGEILEVEFVLQNCIDDPQDLYIFTIATYEKVEKTTSSFERPIPEKERIRSFVPFPYDLSNFQYPVRDEAGNVKKDANGLEMVRLVKFPKDPKKGVDPNTDKPYHLKNKLVVRTTHLSPYRTNYFFFNNVVVLVFDSEGKPAYRQLFEIKGKRGR